MIHLLLAPIYFYLGAVSLLMASYIILSIIDEILPSPKRKGE